MKKRAGNSLVIFSSSLIAVLAFTLTAMGQGPGNTNRLETGGNYRIGPPPSNMMFQITDNPTNAGDDNLVWSHSGRMLAVDRSDPNAPGIGGNKYICLLDVRDLGNIRTIGARSSAITNTVFANITDWTWNDDRVLFGWQPQPPGTPPPPAGKCRLMSCTATGAVNVVPFLQSDPQGGNPTNNVFSPSVVYDQAAGKERLLCLVSTGPDPLDPNPATRINLFTVTFAHGGVPNWADRVQLTRFNSNLPINSVKWCPELGTNYQPICNRLEMMVTYGGGGGAETNKIIIFNGVQEVIADPAKAPVNLFDPHLVVVESNLLANSQVSWTFDGQYLMYGRMGTNTPPAPAAFELYSKRASSPTNPAVKFEVPSSISGEQQQWLCISPDGMKAAFTVNHKIYVIPMQFDNVAVTGAVVTNVLTDASYTVVNVSGAAIPSNTTFSIVAPPTVDTNNFNGEFSGYVRQFTVEGVSSQFNLLTNAAMTLHYSESDIPSGASATNLAVYVYNPQGSAGRTGTWDKLDSVIQTNSQTISCEIQHFSIYAIGRASAQAEDPPFAPSGVSATKGSYQEKVCVSWTAVSNATSYEVWRNTANDSNSAVKLSSDPTSAGYNDTSAEAGTLYYYWVKSKNTTGTSAFSANDTGYAMGVHNAYVADLDGDRKADPIAYYEGIKTWDIKLSGSGYFPAIAMINYLGGPGYVGLAADFDGDLYADPAVYQASTGTWLIKLSSGNYSVLTLANFLGDSCKTAVAADFDGDRLADPAVYESVTGTWILKLSSGGYTALTLTDFLGNCSSTALAADFDGDAKADPVVYEESTGLWGIKFSTAQYQGIGIISLGGSGWKALAGDIDGDRLADPAVFQPASGNWIIELSTGGYVQIPLNAFLGGLP